MSTVEKVKLDKIEFYYDEETGELEHLIIYTKAIHDGMTYGKGLGLNKEDYESLEGDLNEMTAIALDQASKSFQYAIKSKEKGDA